MSKHSKCKDTYENIDEAALVEILLFSNKKKIVYLSPMIPYI